MKRSIISLYFCMCLRFLKANKHSNCDSGLQAIIWFFNVMEQQELTLPCTALTGLYVANSGRLCAGISIT